MIIDDILISSDLFESYFMCDVSACKGACCWEGDFGAPVNQAEKAMIDEVYPKVKKLLSAASIRQIEEKGTVEWFEEPKHDGVTLMDDGACAFLTKDKQGIARCAFEMAHEMGETKFKKPISCHLYPIRISENEETGFAAMNYDRWDICKAACRLGKSNKMPLFRFAKDAILRKYGPDFYIQMEGYYAQLLENHS